MPLGQAIIGLPGAGYGVKPSMADWGSGMSASCTTDPIVCYCNGWPHNAP